MSYHHNGFGNSGGGFGRSGGGFRSSNSYSNHSNGGSGAYGSSSSHSGGFHQNNGPRINETQVPQSKHTIFIRGLHGDITTEEIQDFIGQKVGKISFDFVKLAQDRSKIFVAVRFEKRDEAKQFMETYSDREFMGCRCELSWFRDIRRYCAYQRAKQIRSNSQRRRRRSDSDDDDGDNNRRSTSPVRKSSASRASRSRSRSVKRARTESRSPSRSPKGRGYKRDVVSRSRSRSRSSASSRRSRRSRKSETSSSEDEEDVESRTSSRRSSSRRSSRRPQSESLSRESPKKRVKDEAKLLPQIPLPPKEATPPKAPPTPVESPPPTNPYQEYQQQIQLQQQSSVTYSVPMEEEATPRVLVREEVVEQTCYTAPVSLAPIGPVAPVAPLPPTPKPASPVAPATLLPAFVPRQVGKIEIVMPASLPAAPVLAQAPPSFAPTPSQLQGVSPAAALSASSPSSTKMAALPSGTSGESADTVKFPATNKLFGHLKAFQSALLSTVRYEPPVKRNEEGDEVLGLRLSSMETSEESGEESKAVEREQKLARLSEDQMMRFHIKKKQLETNFRNDCDTYAVVTRALLAKDESLQFGLKISLLENMDDLYAKMMQRVDDHLDAILA